MVYTAGLAHPDMSLTDMLLGAPQPTTHCRVYPGKPHKCETRARQKPDSSSTAAARTDSSDRDEVVARRDLRHHRGIGQLAGPGGGGELFQVLLEAARRRQVERPHDAVRAVRERVDGPRRHRAEEAGLSLGLLVLAEPARQRPLDHAERAARPLGP